MRTESETYGNAMGGFSVDEVLFFINEEKVLNSGGVQFWGLYAPCLYWGQVEAIYFFRRQGGSERHPCLALPKTASMRFSPRVLSIL